MEINIPEIRKSLTAIRHRLVDIREEVTLLEKMINEIEAAQQSEQADLADAELNLNLPPISSTRYRLVRVEPPSH